MNIFLLMKVGAEFKLFLPDHVLPTKAKKKGPQAEGRLPKGCAKKREKVIELALSAERLRISNYFTQV